MGNLNDSWPINPQSVAFAQGDSFRYDWKNEDGVVTNVTYTPATANGYDSSFNVPYMVTTPVRVEEPKDSYGKYRRWVVSLQFPVDYITVAPKPRDGVNWGFMLGSQGPITFNICKINDTPYLGSPWFVTADYMDFQLQLRDTVQFVRATAHASSTGDRVVSNTNVGDPIAAAIEPRTQAIKDAWGTLTSPEVFDCYLDNDVSAANDPSVVRVGDLIVDQNGVKYDIMEVTDRERLDLKTHLVIEKKL